jgi:hypothetical protein
MFEFIVNLRLNERQALINAEVDKLLAENDLPKTPENQYNMLLKIQEEWKNYSVNGSVTKELYMRALTLLILQARLSTNRSNL